MEVREEYNPHKERLNKLKRERERYEEDNFVRLQVKLLWYVDGEFEALSWRDRYY